MAEEFPIIEVRLTSDQVGAATFRLEAQEQMGSKEKFWCHDLASETRYLLKYARPNTGEDWAEKISSELAGEALGLPHAVVELASCNGKAALLSEFFPRDDERLIHGNEILFERDSTYPSREVRRVRKHTLPNVFDALTGVGCPEGWIVPSSVESAADLFCGYLVLDALIGNTDRHHENWGILSRRAANGARILSLAPTYDHGSSLGRELRDPERERRLRGMDKRATLPSYADRAQAAFYDGSDAKRPLGPLEVLTAASDLRESAIRFWISRLATSASAKQLAALVQRVPGKRMSPIAKEYAMNLLEYNMQRILKLFGSP